MPARVDAAIDDLLTIDPTAQIIYTGALTDDSYHVSTRGHHSTIWVHPNHQRFVEIVRSEHHLAAVNDPTHGDLRAAS